METDAAAAGQAADQQSQAGASTPVGSLLLQERQRQGLSEKEVADKLHITMHYVRSVEANQFDKLPGSVFAKGYVKSYALLLGMDVDTVMAHYRADEESSQEQDQELAEQQRSQQRRAWFPRAVAGAAVIFVVGAIVLLLASGGDEEVPVSTAQSSANNAVAAPPSPVRSITDSAEDAAARANSAAAGPAVLAGRSADEFALLGSNPQAASAGVQEPSAIQPEPSAPLSEPSATEPEPSAIGQEPSAIGQEPSATEQGPSAIGQEPSAAEQQPSAIQPAATAAAASQPASDEPASEAVASGADATRSPQPPQSADSPSPDAGSSTIMAVLSAGQDVLQIRFLGESWVEVNDDRAAQAYRDLQDAGDVLQVTGTAPFNVLLGDAAYTRLTLNGEAIDVSDDIRIDNSARVIVGL